MDLLNINELLNRHNEENFDKLFRFFEKNKRDLLTKRGIYIYGSPGSGKTEFVKNILKKLNYDIILFDAGDVRNKNIIEDITKHNMSDKNILSLFHQTSKK